MRGKPLLSALCCGGAPNTQRGAVLFTLMQRDRIGWVGYRHCPIIQRRLGTLKALNKINVLLRKIEVYVGAGVIGMIFILTTLNIFLRYLFNSPIRWAEEVICYGFIWLGYMAICYTLSMDGHVRFTLLLDKLSKKARAVTCFVLDMLVAATFIAMGPSVIKCFGFMISTPSLEIWEGYFFLIVPIGYVLIIFHTLMNAISRFKPDAVDMVALYSEEEAGFLEALQAADREGK